MTATIIMSTSTGCVSQCVIYLSASAPYYLTLIGGGNNVIEMDENAAYGHVTSQSGQHVPLPDDSETLYDNI